LEDEEEKVRLGRRRKREMLLSRVKAPLFVSPYLKMLPVFFLVFLFLPRLPSHAF
jgi:hypothetical protein